MFSIGLGMTLKPGGYPGYKQAHDEAWPQLLEQQRAHGVNMVIYRWGDRLFVHATAPSEADWLKTRQGPLVEKWHDYMTEFLETDEQGKVRFELLEPAFRFGAFEE